MKYCLYLFLTSLLISHVHAVSRIKFATIAPEGTSWMKAMHDFNDQLKLATEGRVEFIFFPGGIAGDEKDILRKMRYDKIHATGVTGVGMGILVPESRILDLPFFFKNYDEVDRVHEALFDHFAAKFRQSGMELIAWSEVGWTYLFSSKDVSNQAIYPELKMWTWGNDPIALRTLQELGTNPVSIPIGDVLTSLQTGLLDTIYCPPLAAIAMQWSSKVKYVLTEPLVHSSGAFLMTQKQFKQLSSEDQNHLKLISKKVFSKLTLKTRQENNEAMKTLKNSLIPVKPDAILEENFLNVSDTIQKRFSGELYNDALLERVKQLKTTEKQ